MHICSFIVNTLFHLYCIPRLIIYRRAIRNYCSRSRLIARASEKIFDMRNDLRCDKASEIGVTRLATVRCPTGLAFDIERQTCDWKTNVKNCDQLESKRTSCLFP